MALRAWQEHLSRHAVDALRGLVTTTATVRRRPRIGGTIDRAGNEWNTCAARSGG